MMTKHDIAILACKILGLYTMVEALLSLSITSTSVMGFFSDPHQSPYIAGYIGSLVLHLVFGVLIWIYADFLAGRITAVMQIPETTHQAIGIGDAQKLAISLLGLFVLTHAIPKLTESLTQIFFEALGLTGLVNPLRTHEKWVPVVANSVECAVGLWLLTKAEGLVVWLRRFREAGLSSIEGDSKD